jgi:hypothetical protein
MMAVLHELLAAEKTVTNARDRLAEDTDNKFRKAENYFVGGTKTLELIGDDPSNKQVEAAARADKELATTVVATLDYYLGYWAKAESLLAQKNITNTIALSHLSFRGKVIAENVPVDELMGLEVRLTDFRKLALLIPTLDASRAWAVDASAQQPGTWKSILPTVTTKTEKIEFPVVLAPATVQHPAQVKVSTGDKVVGTFTTQHLSGATTAIQKANLLSVIDDLIIEVKSARVRANSVGAVTPDVPIGQTIKSLLMEPLLNSPINNAV